VVQGDDVWVDTGAEPCQLDTPADLRNNAPIPPPAELLHTTYDMWPRRLGKSRRRIGGAPDCRGAVTQHGEQLRVRREIPGVECHMS